MAAGSIGRLVTSYRSLYENFTFESITACPRPQSSSSSWSSFHRGAIIGRLDAYDRVAPSWERDIEEHAPLNSVSAGDTILLISDEGKRYLLQTQAGQRWYTHRGSFSFDDIIGKPYGQVVETDMGRRYLVLRPTTSDLIQEIKRRTQIVFPKDAARLVMELDLWNGRRLIEAGTGSGGLTLAFARAVMPAGRVYSYESRSEHQQLARENLERLGLMPYVELKHRDIALGFDERDVDALFLDVRQAAAYVHVAERAMAESGIFASLQPTVNQVSDLVAALEAGQFADVRVEEVMIRSWKTVPDRIRPEDRMIAHTGFLIFARKLHASSRIFWMNKRQRRRAVEYDAQLIRSDDEV